jgi:hypothetical protein
MNSESQRVNAIGFLGLVGFVGFLGVIYDKPEAYTYFAYFWYFRYFPTRFTVQERWEVRTAAATAYFLAFAVNMVFISVSYVRGAVDYEAGFYVAYMVGSISFPLTSIGMDVARGIKQTRLRHR